MHLKRGRRRRRGGRRRRTRRRRRGIKGRKTKRKRGEGKGKGEYNSYIRLQWEKETNSFDTGGWTKKNLWSQGRQTRMKGQKGGSQFVCLTLLSHTFYLCQGKWQIVCLFFYGRGGASAPPRFQFAGLTVLSLSFYPQTSLLSLPMISLCFDWKQNNPRCFDCSNFPAFWLKVAIGSDIVISFPKSKQW